MENQNSEAPATKSTSSSRLIFLPETMRLPLSTSSWLPTKDTQRSARSVFTSLSEESFAYSPYVVSSILHDVNNDTALLAGHARPFGNATEIESGYVIEFNGLTAHLRYPFLAILLGFFSFITIAGNLLVVYAICSKRYLHSMTNCLIASLAVADLIVGLLVMPFNTLFEITDHVWLFGFILCDVWHAVDILASTASIWNLCVISLDRLSALKNPFTYTNAVMNTKRMFSSIAGVWICSILLSFPAIAWWRYESPELYIEKGSCAFVDDLSFLLLSSLVSFYIPLCIMLYAYWQIYIIASNHQQSFKTGLKRATGVIRFGTGGNKTRQQRPSSLRLRIHRGKSITNKQPSYSSFVEAVPNNNHAAISNSSSAKAPLKQLGSSTSKASNQELEIPRCGSCSLALNGSRSFSSRVHKARNMTAPPSPKRFSTGACLETIHAAAIRKLSKIQANGNGVSSAHQIATEHSDNHALPVSASAHMMPLIPENALRCLSTTGRLSKSNIGKTLTRFSRETKAAKTLAIVIGCFILCWLPFFVVNVMNGICTNCLADYTLVFTIVTWLGHCNSMLNPFIYSFFNTEFRHAFANILCCGLMTKRKKAKQRIVIVRSFSRSAARPLNCVPNSNRGSLQCSDYSHSDNSYTRRFSAQLNSEHEERRISATPPSGQSS